MMMGQLINLAARRGNSFDDSLMDGKRNRATDRGVGLASPICLRGPPTLWALIDWLLLPAYGYGPVRVAGPYKFHEFYEQLEQFK